VSSASEDLTAWDDVAECYEGVVGVKGDLISERFNSFLWRNLGDELAGRSVLDLGCGHGWLAASIHDRGAQVVGVDGSKRLLELARRSYPEIPFHQVDLVGGLPTKLESIGFDRVLSHMVLMDLPKLDALGTSLRRCIRPDGRLILTMLHPAFFMQSPFEDAETGERYRKVRGYLNHEEWWITTFGGHRHYHRPLGFYVNWLAAAGFAVVELYEPPVPRAEAERDWSDYDRWFTTIPTMLGLVAVPIADSVGGG
jgi:SAM-dependent methyltransferase